MTPAVRDPRTPPPRAAAPQARLGGASARGTCHRGTARRMGTRTATDGQIPTLQKPNVHDADPRLPPLSPGARGGGLAALSAAQRRVVLALLEPDERGEPPTYRAVAGRLGVHIGTVSRLLKRVRDHHRELYDLVMRERAAQLGVRHRHAVSRAAARSYAWHRKQANRRYRERF